ncbi:hypothetical protein CONPUDRAFT_80065 [Coniophora puteana RWD-64-598 SS2]|uniref:Uncharacterized protein n=1 Tax=Coniophora puteana (strain RWD-64-598) TaxID=741705 RepID=A0A5M3N3M2_CONPW|nr:uncharacterized protein CONPUDRAFT_80065 [Coniophora puteana RWD-64-598 SS2]EIW85491.1 hypothetical protein CONPUDRAFT_80065 [Coniophora puteana RWD-64-598 SS2]
MTPSYTPPAADSEDDELDLEAIHQMVAQTKGFYARDYSMALGWNNMRYIIETSMYHGKLLNRTVVLPSFVYARSCEHPNDVCAAYVPMVNRGDAVGSDEWRDLPPDEQMAWRIPLGTMLDLRKLRQNHPVILLADYLRLHGLAPSLERSNGQWDEREYLAGANVFTGETPGMRAVENAWYDPRGVNRVDRLPAEMRERGGWDEGRVDVERERYGDWSVEHDGIHNILVHQLPKEGRSYVLEFSKAREVLQGYAVAGVETDEGLTRVLQKNGWEALYTYDGALGMDYVKNVVNPILQAAPRDSIRGLVEDFAHYDEDVLYVKGEIHYERKPASLRFTTPERRDDFSRLVMFDMHPPQKVLDLAAKLGSRMLEMNEGRMWMAAHMRRGDFARLGWAMESDFAAHLERIQNHLKDGRERLQTLKQSGLQTYNVPDVPVNAAFYEHEPPQQGDRYYIATDERDPANLQHLRDNGGVLAASLITPEDRRAFGWDLLVTDVLGLVEQALIGRSHYFYAHALSSVAGGAMNLRAAGGMDPRTAYVD